MRAPDKLGFGTGAQAQLVVLAPEAHGFDGALDDDDQAIGLERLLDEVVGALLDRGDGGLDRSVSGDNDDRHLGVIAPEHIQKLQAVEPAALEPNVEDHQRRTALIDRREGTIGVTGAAGCVPFVLQDPRDELQNVLFVVHDENVGCHFRLTSLTPALRQFLELLCAPPSRPHAATARPCARAAPMISLSLNCRIR